MTKSGYLRLASAFLLPYTTGKDGKWSLEEALKWAEAIWARTGGDEPARVTGQRKSADHYAGLPEPLRQGFDRVWDAYRHKAGKQKAAARWAEIDPDAALVERIVQAAGADAATQRPDGHVRKYLEGWLSERRWEDYAPSPRARQDPAKQRQRERAQELAHARRMAALEASGGYWSERVTALEQQV
jgi:hypothetical protein